MALRKIVFDNATVTARDMGTALAGVLVDGRVSGAAVTYAGGNVGVAIGYLIAAGRLIENNEAATIALTGTAGVAQVVLVLDVSGAGTVSLTTRYAASLDALPALTQEDINGGSATTYEMEVAVVDLTAGALVRSMGPAGYPIRVVDQAPSAGAADGLYLIPQEVS